jgi:hypothetical protein
VGLSAALRRSRFKPGSSFLESSMLSYTLIADRQVQPFQMPLFQQQ